MRRRKQPNTQTSLPTIERPCPKCKKNTTYVNTQKFRVNANKKNLDIWIIFQCNKCKSTFNLTLYERVKPSSFEGAYLERLMQNDCELASSYAFKPEIYVKNKVNSSLKVNEQPLYKKKEAL